MSQMKKTVWNLIFFIISINFQRYNDLKSDGNYDKFKRLLQYKQVFICLSSQLYIWDMSGLLSYLFIHCHSHKALVLPSFPIKMCFKVRSCTLLQTARHDSLICLLSPLIIMFIKISPVPPHLSLHQILFMPLTAHMHSGPVMYFLCSIYLQLTQNAQGALDMW